MIGTGLYTLGEITTFTQIPASQLRRWLRGYRSGHKTCLPLWTSELSDSPLPQALGFHDLLEVRVVHAFRQYGVSLPTIRRACQHAREYFKQSYPLTCQRFLTDGRNVFAEILEQTGEVEDTRLLDMVQKQDVFDKVMRPSLRADIDYDAKGGAQRWFPVDRTRRIVLDPARNFGKPILTESGVPTETLFAAYQVGQDSRRVAAIYEVSIPRLSRCKNTTLSIKELGLDWQISTAPVTVTSFGLARGNRLAGLSSEPGHRLRKVLCGGRVADVD